MVPAGAWLWATVRTLPMVSMALLVVDSSFSTTVTSTVEPSLLTPRSGFGIAALATPSTLPRSFT